MPTYIRIKDLPNSASSLNTDDYIMLSGAVAGARKILKADFMSTVADTLNATPNTYKLATLDASNKVDSSQWPASAFSYQGTWAASTNTPTLADGTGTSGYTYYASDSGSVNFGAGAISFTAGDAVVYNGSIWQKVPAVANILDGSATAEQGRTALDVNSIAQDAESSGTKLVGPSMRFDGSNDYIEFSDNDAFTFSNSTDDTPFSISAWVKMADAQYFAILSKNGSTSSLKEWFLWTDQYNVLQLWLRDTSGNYVIIPITGNLNDYVNEWTHISVSYGGAGPASSVGFANADSTVNFYINGKIATKATATYSGTYSGMSATTQPLKIGEVGGVYAEGEIRDVKLFNKELSAIEVKTLCLSGSLPESFAESTGTSNLVTNGDFSSGSGWVTNSDWTVGSGVATTTGVASNYLYQAGSATSGKRHRLSFDFTRTSGSGNIIASYYDTTYRTIVIDSTNASGKATGEFIAPSNGNIYFRSTSGWAGSVDNVSLVQIGAVLDARAEQFDTSTAKLYDLSGNDFVGTNNGATLLGREFPVYETGTWSGSIEFGGASTGQTYATNNCNFSRTGNVVHVQGILTLSAKGSSTGTARIAGLPFTSSSDTSQAGLSINYGTGFASLTSLPSALVSGSATTALVCNWGAAGITALTELNFTDATSIRFSGSYKIS